MSDKTLRILLAESDPSEAIKAVRALYAGADTGLQLTVVSTIATLLSSLKVAHPEVILLDLSLYISEPYDAVRVVHRAAPGVPLIVFSDPADKQRAAQSLTEGAIDYLLKGFMDPRTMDRALRSALERNTMEGLADLLRDPVTGLYTREGFLTLAAREQTEARRRGGAFVLLCARIENLQMLREGFGPGAGDRALSEIAKILNGCCRRTDVVARLGEEQFAVLLVDAIAPTVSVLRQRVEQHLAIRNKANSPWAPLEIRLSAGMWAARDDRSFAEFLDAVEAELRRTPEGGEVLVVTGSGAAERA
jgi:diguanylate cyclase (GGDEF)-like protein